MRRARMLLERGVTLGQLEICSVMCPFPLSLLWHVAVSSFMFLAQSETMAVV